jgi:hypothetical protein
MLRLDEKYETQHFSFNPKLSLFLIIVGSDHFKSGRGNLFAFT